MQRLEDVVFSLAQQELENSIDQPSRDHDDVSLSADVNDLIRTYLRTRGDGAFDPASTEHVWSWTSTALGTTRDERGKGWMCLRDLEPGSLIACATPLVHVLDRHATAGVESSVALLARLIECLRTMSNQQEATKVMSTTMAMLRDLHPRKPHGNMMKKMKIQTPLSKTLRKQAVTILQQVSNCQQGWDRPWSREEELYRLLECCFCNAMGLYQNAEQLSFTSRYAKFQGTALYPSSISLFNHSCTPNVARTYFGTVVCCRTTQRVARGDTLSISYVESEVLTLPRELRWVELREACGVKRCLCPTCRDNSSPDGETDSQLIETFGDDLKRLVASVPSDSRLPVLLEIQRGMETLKPPLCPTVDDMLRLHTELGICYLQQHSPLQALHAFQRCHALVRERLGHNDEAIICFALQEARCCAALFLLAPNGEKARKFERQGQQALQESFRVHQLIFGGQNDLYWTRLRHEIHADALLPRGRLHAAIPSLLAQWVGYQKNLPSQTTDRPPPEAPLLLTMILDYKKKKLHQKFIASVPKHPVASKRHQQSLQEPTCVHNLNVSRHTKRRRISTPTKEAYHSVKRFLKFRRVASLGHFASGCL